MKTIDEMCKVMQAFKNGNNIEFSMGGEEWTRAIYT